MRALGPGLALSKCSLCDNIIVLSPFHSQGRCSRSLREYWCPSGSDPGSVPKSNYPEFKAMSWLWDTDSSFPFSEPQFPLYSGASTSPGLRGSCADWMNQCKEGQGSTCSVCSVNQCDRTTPGCVSLCLMPPCPLSSP